MTTLKNVLAPLLHFKLCHVSSYPLRISLSLKLVGMYTTAKLLLSLFMNIVYPSVYLQINYCAVASIEALQLHAAIRP